MNTIHLNFINPPNNNVSEESMKRQPKPKAIIKTSLWGICSFLAWTAHAAVTNNTNNLATRLQNNSLAVKNSIISNVSTQQNNNARRLQIQMRIDSLRNEIGAARDRSSRSSKENQLRQLQQQLMNIK
ncbi:hypothetical protein [Pantoea sp.]|uniref:hypothetical protein n=1 Tax=Pantoea sp. TaxID=69393 RepID=UPI0028AC59D9|nr:hypothetical protein [Pantoea sp.]